MKVKLFFSCIAVFLGIIIEDTTVYSQVPPWAVSHTYTSYPAGQFLLGVGSGTGREAGETAKQFAQSDIAAQLRAKLGTEVRDIQQAYHVSQNEETYADFKIKSTSIVDDLLSAVEIVETAVDSSTNTTYALAVLNKKKFSERIAAELTGGWTQVKDLHDVAETLFGQGKLTEAIQNLTKARTTATDLLPKQALYNAVARMPFSIEPSLGPVELTSSIRATLSSIHIEKKGGDKQKAKIGEKFPEPFVVRVVADAGNNSVPVTGTVVDFLSSSGAQLAETTTDEKGVASCIIRAEGDIGRQLHARVSLPSLGDEFSSSINSSSVPFSCLLLDADVAFSLKVEARSSKVSDILRLEVTDAVTRFGYQIVDMSRFTLMVGFQSEPVAIVDSGDDGTLYSVSSNATLELIDEGSGRMLGLMNDKSKGIANTENAALEKSARGVQFDEGDLISLLEKAKD